MVIWSSSAEAWKVPILGGKLVIMCRGLLRNTIYRMSPNWLGNSIQHSQYNILLKIIVFPFKTENITSADVSLDQ